MPDDTRLPPLATATGGAAALGPAGHRIIGHRFRGAFAYVTATMPDGDSMPLMRLRYGGSAARWGFAVYLASKDGYEDSVLPTGDLAGAPEDALDTACGLYLGDPTAWA